MLELKVIGDTLEEIFEKMKAMTSHIVITGNVEIHPDTFKKEPVISYEEEEEKPKAKRGRPAKKVEPEQVEMDEDVLGGEEKELTIEDDVMPAFVAYVQKHSKDEAKKILAKFKVKAVRELKPEQYAAAIKAVSGR